MSALLERMGLWALHKVDPERAHGLAIKALQFGLAEKAEAVTSPRLSTQIAGIPLQNPVGLAAGSDFFGDASEGIVGAGDATAFGAHDTGNLSGSIVLYA